MHSPAFSPFVPLALAFVLLRGTSLSAAGAADDWPEFRGPTGQGLAAAAGLPLEWSTQKNVAWKVAVPGSGWSSPTVSRGLVFLTTGVAADGESPSLRTLCFDVATGDLRWNTEVFAPSETTTQGIHKKNSLASPTPLIEGDRIYVHFGHHGTACLDRTGRIVWRNRSLGYEPVHGNAGSPVLAGPKFQKLASNKLGERTFASYAVSGRSLLLRTERHLYRIVAPGP